MPDSNIGALPLAPNVADDSLLLMEQQGAAMRLTGMMLKEYAKQGVALEFREDLEASQAAADRAEGAVSAVVDMTVSAGESNAACVEKSMREGKVHLRFGLPRGGQGVPGPAGAAGPRGPQGAPGNGLTILGHYDTEAALRAAAAAPDVGDAYSVGAEPPYDTYIFDGVSLDWRNYGPLTGGGGGVPLENAVTSAGGAELMIPDAFGDAPHVITFTGEEEPTLTASDVECENGRTVQENIDGLFISVSDGKALIASAVTDKGVPTEQDATFQEMAEHIGQIRSGSDTSDATATPGDILGGKTAYTASGKVEGIIPFLPAQAITPGTSAKTIAGGQYLAGTQTIQGDPNLVSSNIRKGASIFGVSGAVESSFAAVLTVKADIGAVVTAACGDVEVEALSTTGTVVMELPVEGTWKVTAVRGMAQYNTATIEVTNQYSAELTATLHVERLMRATPLDASRYGLSAAAIGDYVIFGGGRGYVNYTSTFVKNADAYDKELTHVSLPDPPAVIYDGAAASTKSYAVFAGLEGAMAYSAALVGSSAAPLGTERLYPAAVSIGAYALFAGGQANSSSATKYPDADAYDDNLTRTTPTALASAMSKLAAASNGEKAIFAGTAGANAYDKNLTRSIITPLNACWEGLSAARAGNYILFAGGSSSVAVVAYDLTLTRTTAEPLGTGRGSLAGTTLRDFAVLGGGSNGSGTGVDTVDVYDPYLVRTSPTELSPARGQLAAAAIGDYALFGGGFTGSAASDCVEVYRYT